MSNRLLSTYTSLSTAPTTLFLRHSRIPCQRCFYKISENTPPAPSPTQPVPHRPYDARKTVLHRKYISLLRSTPLLVFFQHYNTRGGELAALRRELDTSLRNIDAARLKEHETAAIPDLSPPIELAPYVKMSVLNTPVFKAALVVADFLPTDMNVSASGREAYLATYKRKRDLELAPILSGPIGVLEFPVVSTPHLMAALSLLFPAKMTFKKGTDPLFISGVNKLLLLGTRIDKETIDAAKTRWVGGLGGIEQLRGELVAVMQSVGQSLVGGLEAPSRGLWYAMEGRRTMMEEEVKPKEESTVQT